MNQHPSKELLQPCAICGQRHFREEIEKWYYYDGNIICSHHPGAKEWYEMAINMADAELALHTAEDNLNRSKTDFKMAENYLNSLNTLNTMEAK